MSHLTVAERRNAIIELLNESGRVKVNNLSEQFGVTGVAIRSDLAELEKKGLLTRVHGGAITSYKSYYDMSFVQRSNTNAPEKKAIARAISSMIHNNDTIMMNAGTTPLFVMRELGDKVVTIVTNSIALALEGSKKPNLKILLLGGNVDASYQFTYGLSALRELDRYTADVLVLSVDGVDVEKGITTFYHEEAELCKKMIKNAKQTVVAADFSKIDRVAFAEVDSIMAIDKIVTNKKDDMSPVLEQLRALDIEVIDVS